jgi:plasmid maintenance system antidote protein VapI
MPKPKHRSKATPGWFVAEWLDYLTMQQTDLIEATGRSKGRISELVSGRQRFNEDDLAAFSRALGVTRGFLLEVNPDLYKKTAEGRAYLDRGRIAPPPLPRPKGRDRA